MLDRDRGLMKDAVGAGNVGIGAEVDGSLATGVADSPGGGDTLAGIANGGFVQMASRVPSEEGDVEIRF